MPLYTTENKNDERGMSMSSCKVRIGYACINLSLGKKFRTFRWKSVEDQDIQKIKEVIQHNIILLGDIIYDNIKKNIFVYRVTAEIIPFIDKPEIKELIEKHEILSEPKIQKEFERIRKWQKQYNLRISMHSSHFTMLASPKEDIVQRSIGELRAQSEFLKRIGGQNLVIHIGGAYGNKEETLERFKEHLKAYKIEIDVERLTIENDDKTYSSEEVVRLCKELGLKWVYDYHHERCNPSKYANIIELLREYPPDKYHLSSGIDDIIKPPHADYILKEDMEGLINQLDLAGIKQADIIFEAKKKDLSIFEIMEPMENGYWKIKTTKL